MSIRCLQVKITINLVISPDNHRFNRTRNFNLPSSFRLSQKAHTGLLELSSESMKECLEVIECYILLGGETFIGGRHGSDLALAISSLITDVRDEALVMVARLIETMLRVS